MRDMYSTEQPFQNLLERETLPTVISKRLDTSIATVTYELTLTRKNVTP